MTQEGTKYTKEEYNAIVKDQLGLTEERRHELHEEIHKYLMKDDKISMVNLVKKAAEVGNNKIEAAFVIAGAIMFLRENAELIKADIAPTSEKEQE